MTFALEPALDVLGRTPNTLRSLLGGLAEDWVMGNEGPRTWSPHDVVGHLIHGEETDWIPRARIILELGESRTFEPFDRFAFADRSRGKSIDDLLDTFEQLRHNNLQKLRGWNLTQHELELAGSHPDFGRVTMRQLLATWVVHDLSHIAQVARVMAKQYHVDVGPWKAYLRVLHG